MNTAVAEAIRWACVTELAALKPGNVGLHGAGHGMHVADFLTSAACIAPLLALPGWSVGERIYRCIAATRAAVGCNTNLGIVLLCAPLAQAVLHPPDPGVLLPAGEGVKRVLAELDQTDTDWVFRAIRLANPGGLGDSAQHDVHAAATAALVEVMRTAAARDRIAYQYAHDFADIFGLGLDTWTCARPHWPDAAWTAVEVYLAFLAAFPDTHIVRKFGMESAQEIQQIGKRLLQYVKESRQPEQVRALLLDYDCRLKQDGINPGTSADLTVATLFANQLQNNGLPAR